MTFSMISPPKPITLAVSLAPAYNAINSMDVILHTISNASVDNWLMRRGGSLFDEDMERYRLFLDFFGVEVLCMVVDGASALDFESYLDLLEGMDATTLRDRLLHSQLRSVRIRVLRDKSQANAPDAQTALDNRDVYVAFFEEQLQAQGDDPDLPDDIHDMVAKTHDLLNDPARLKSELVKHLENMWFDHFLLEWEGVKPGLEGVVRAVSAIALDKMPLYDALEAITGRNLRGVFDDDELASYERIEFVPSRHNGPYISWFGNAGTPKTPKTLWIIYGARIRAASDSVLDTSHLLNCLNAIGDATRLNILMAIREHEELSTQQIIELFELNKSAASRHLRQLRANELIVEHREDDNKTKFYSLNPDTIAEVISSMNQLLG